MCCCVCRRCRHLCIPYSVIAGVLALSVVVLSATDPPRPPLPWLSPTIGPSGEPSDDDDNEDPTGEPCLQAVHHGIFVVLVVPICLRHRRHWCRPPEMPLSQLV